MAFCVGLYKLVKKSTPNYYPKLFISPVKTMSQKGKQAKKIEQEQPSIDEQIVEIHDKKQVSDQIYYLVVFKGSPNTRKQWRSETQLKPNPTFHKAYLKYQLLAKRTKPKVDNLKQTNVQQMSVEKDVQGEKEIKGLEEKVVGMMRKIHIDKEKIKVAVEKKEQQQMLLDNFMGKIKVKQTGKTQSTGKLQETQSLNQLKTIIQPDTPMLSTKQKLDQPIQQQKPLSPIKNESTKPQPALSAAKVNPMWIEKIKSVNKVKGYEIRNGQILYEIEASDRNGQNFFLPPMPTDVVMRYDAVKLAVFLQDCLLRGFTENAKTK